MTLAITSPAFGDSKSIPARYTCDGDDISPPLEWVSTRKVTAIIEELCGLEVTSTQVSRAAAELDEQFDAWWNRPIGEITYLILDARYEKIRHDGAIRSCALLTAIGIDTDGKRSVLGCSVQLSEAEPHWR
jgi:transposase-like protein